MPSAVNFATDNIDKGARDGRGGRVSVQKTVELDASTGLKALVYAHADVIPHVHWAT